MAKILIVDPNRITLRLLNLMLLREDHGVLLKENVAVFGLGLGLPLGARILFRY